MRYIVRTNVGRFKFDRSTVKLKQEVLKSVFMKGDEGPDRPLWELGHKQAEERMAKVCAYVSCDSRLKGTRYATVQAIPSGYSSFGND
jgi:hypothetical protein